MWKSHTKRRAEKRLQSPVARNRKETRPTKSSGVKKINNRLRDRAKSLLETI